MDEPIDKAIARIAARQHGNITRRQLLLAGVRSNAIDRRVIRGRLIRVHAGVYAVGHAPTDPLGRAAAAVLACGDEAALFAESAQWLWGWRKDWRIPFELVAPSCHRRSGIVLHRCALEPEDIRIQLGIRVTSPARTVLDLAPRLTTRKAVTRLVNAARESSYLTLGAIAETLDRYPHHPGVKLLVQFVERDTGRLLSELEIDFAEFCARFDLPIPQTNVIVGDYLVDAWFERERVVVELDSRGFHLTPESFETDRERDAHMLDLGIETVRITRERLRTNPAREATRMHRILARRRLQVA